jgi:hypothetical protein
MENKYKKYFDAHKDVNEFHFTSDGLAFFDKGKAQGHQKELNGKPSMVKSIKRPKAKKENPNQDRIEELTELLEEKRNQLLDLEGEDKEALEEEILELEVELENLK